MKHTEVYGLRTRGTKSEVKGTLASMEETEGGVNGGGLGQTSPENLFAAENVRRDSTHKLTIYTVYVYIKNAGTDVHHRKRETGTCITQQHYLLSSQH